MECAALTLLPDNLPAQVGKTATPASSGGSGTGASETGASVTGKLPGYAGKMLHSDMNRQSGKGAEAKPDPKKPHQMSLTKKEQDILNGSKGQVMAKIMKIVVAHGNAFGADKLVNLGGASHSSMYFGTEYMAALIKIFDECADAGLKAYAPYTVNPRPYDVYNVNNNPKDIELIYEGYALQRDVDYIHS